MKKYKDVDTYITNHSKSLQGPLKSVRVAIKKSAPHAEESISYGMPAYTLNGKPLVYFAGFKNHIGLYATPSANVKFARELSKYKQGKGSIQFPVQEKLPLGLISKIVKFKVTEIRKASKIKTACSRGHVFIKSGEYPVCPKCWPGYYVKKSRS